MSSGPSPETRFEARGQAVYEFFLVRPIATEFGPDTGGLADDALETVTGGSPAIQNSLGAGGFIIDWSRQALGGPDTKALGGPDTSGWAGIELLR